VTLQVLYFFVSFSSKDVQISPNELEVFHKEIDSLRQVEIENRKPKMYPFNPNYITDYKGYTLGMTNEEIDRLLEFRKQDQWINSAKEFQQVTQVSDSLLHVLSPYFKFPDWVTNPKPKTDFLLKNTNQPKTFEQKQDLNTATASQLQKVNGIGEAYSKRIIAYRDKFGGFIADVQLQEIYGLSPDVIESLKEHFTVKTPKQVDKISLNSATLEQLVTVPHIDYEIAHHILEQRTLRDGYYSMDELLKVKSFPSNKFEIIKLYLKLN